MLDYIYNYLTPKKHEQVNFLKMNMYIKKTKEKINTYLNTKYQVIEPIQSKGLEYLYSLLTRIDLHEIMEITSVIDQIFYIRNYILDSYESYIIGGGKILLTNNFIGKTQSFIDTDEIIIVITESPDIKIYEPYMNNIKQYLLKKKEYNEINDNIEIYSNFDILLFQQNNIQLRPFYMLYNNSKELTLTIKNGYIQYEYDQPSMSVFSINIEKLLMGALYFLWTTDIDRQYLYKYLHQNCIIPLLLDTEDIFLLTILDYILDIKLDNKGKDITLKDIDTSIFSNMNSQYGSWMRTNLNDCIKDIVDKVNLVSHKNLTPEGYLSNFKMFNYESLFEYINFLINDNKMLDNINNRWMLFLKELQVFKIILKLYKLVPTYSNTRNMVRRLNSLLLNYKTSRFWSKCKDIVTRNTIQNEINELYSEIRELSR